MRSIWALHVASSLPFDLEFSPFETAGLPNANLVIYHLSGTGN